MITYQDWHPDQVAPCLLPRDISVSDKQKKMDGRTDGWMHRWMDFRMVADCGESGDSPHFLQLQGFSLLKKHHTIGDHVTCVVNMFNKPLLRK